MNNLTLKPIESEDIDIMKIWLNKEYIKKWYNNPEEWLGEIRKRNKEFNYINYFIAIDSNKPIGFFQYYDCFYAKEEWYDVNFETKMYHLRSKEIHYDISVKIDQILTNTILYFHLN